jgi:hypothetical protein
MAVESPTAPTRPRHRRLRETEDGRRALTAGHALVIALLALAIGCLLNAPGIHKSAYNQPAGWKRDVALAITGPLADLSHALLLDRPRKLLQDALGRGDDDRIDTTISFTPPTTPTTPVSRPPRTSAPGAEQPKPSTAHTPAAKPHPKPKPEPRPAFSPSRKLRLWIAGDSLVITPGWAIIRAAGHARAILPVGGGPDGRVATGLERPDVFNWFTHIAEQVRKLRPNAVVLDFGGNDDHGYMTGLPKGTGIGDFGSASWSAEYRRRVAGLLDSLGQAGVFVVWIGLPITRDAAQTQRFDTINAITESEARKRKGRVAFIDTYASFASDSGGFAQYLTDSSGKQILVRAPDGVHFERAGGDIIARSVLHALNQRFDLTSWRRKPPRT